MWPRRYSVGGRKSIITMPGFSRFALTQSTFTSGSAASAPRAVASSSRSDAPIRAPDFAHEYLFICRLLVSDGDRQIASQDRGDRPIPRFVFRVPTPEGFREVDGLDAVRRRHLPQRGADGLGIGKQTGFQFEDFHQRLSTASAETIAFARPAASISGSSSAIAATEIGRASGREREKVPVVEA